MQLLLFSCSDAPIPPPLKCNQLLQLAIKSIISILLKSLASMKGFSFSFFFLLQVLKILVHNFSVFVSSLRLLYKLFLREQVAVGL